VKDPKELRILVAEDNSTFRKLMSAMIERITGRVPESAVDGVDAVNKVCESDFDLVFMDNHMPRLSGVEATCKIRQSLPDARQPRIVAVSGSSDIFDMSDFEKAGMDALLCKPFHLNALAASINEALMTQAKGRSAFTFE
jgi:CheY-like chemotaxis protein